MAAATGRGPAWMAGNRATEGDTFMAGPPAPQPDGSDPNAPQQGGSTAGGDAGAPGFSQDDIEAALAAAAGGEEIAGNAAASPAGASLHESAAAAAAQSPGASESMISEPDAESLEAEDEHSATDEALGDAADASPPPGSMPLELPDFTPRSGEVAGGIAMLSDVKLNVKIELGRSEMLIEDVLKLGEGSVVELDKLAGDPVDVLVNNRLVARGEVLVLNDNFCVRISQIMSGTGLDDD